MSWRSGGSWRVALKIARRDVWRAKGRSALVIAMIGVPVLLITVASLLIRSSTDTAADEALRTMGPTDALVTVAGSPLEQTFDGAQTVDVEGATLPDPADAHMSPQRLGSLTGGEVLSVRYGKTLVRTDEGALAADVREFDLHDARTRGLGTLVEGRAPNATDEVTVSRDLADRGFGPGERIQVGTQRRELRVVGVARDPSDLRSSQLVGLSGSVLRGEEGPSRTVYLVDTSSGLTWPRVRTLNAHGLVVQSRAVLDNPPPDDQLPPGIARWLREEAPPTTDAVMIAFTVLVAAGVLLEVVLLAGPAFAVGARRQRRQLALVVATGGTPKDVRRIVLAQGLVLGFGSALAGIVAGILLVALTWPLSSQLIGHEFTSLRVSPVDLGALLVVGTLAALAAAYVPAHHASRQDTVVALAGRRGITHTRRGLPFIGLALMAAGGFVVLVLGRANGGEWRVVLGTFVLVAGAIMVTPALITLVGRLGGHLPLSLRLATRDSARNHSRTTPAVAAIIGVVTGVTALAIGSASDFEQNHRDYVPRAPMGSMTIGLEGSEVTPRAADGLAEQVRTELPGRTAFILHNVTSYPSDTRDLTAALVDPKCREQDPYGCAVPLDGNEYFTTSTTTVDGMMVADANLVANVLGHPLTADQRRVLSAGGVLVPSKAALYPDHTAQVATFRTRNGSDGSVTTRDVQRTRLPAAVLPATRRHSGDYTYLANLVATPATAKRLGLPTAVHSTVVPPGTPAVSKEQEAQVKEIVQGLGYGSDIYVERGFVDTYTLPFLGLAILGGLLVLVGTATATALALNDARPDFATLAAVGATPRTRRRMAMAQAAVIGVLGAGLGVVVGAVPGIAVTWPLTAVGDHPTPVIDIPWTLLGIVVVGVPILAILGAGIFTRSSLPMVRRVE